MRSIVNGFLSYGVVNVPVGICSTASRKDISFKTLHKECGNTISSPKECVTCQLDNLTTDELVRGYEYAKKQYVVLPEEELTQLAAERSKVIRIKKFVAWDEVDELQVDSSYYLQPNAMLVRPYTLLSNAMGEKGAVGIGSQSLWGKEHPSMVWVKEGGALILSNLFCYDEVVSDQEIQGLLGLVPDEEQQLANEFVSLMMRTLDPQQDFVSYSRRRTAEYIEAKLNGLDLEFAEPEKMPEPTVDITEQLRASIEAARKAA